ncbi:MAG: NTP transferase domain-containing protein [Candidatus Nitronauta litoralis]|uniref:NTP transferase domain-containing protein n=1 Tax=Candidatus Nitronauta litoralis TaxID=2705533 RepID=A0A7T0BUL3_9BACT|nr:MAG: NTP transferase domain-containing protein [Candidatus Nitronauta litoralis]
MNALILLAGYGSRLSREDLPHKVFLDFGGESLLNKHLKTLQNAGIEKTVLVVGYNKGAIKDAVAKMDLTMPIEFIDNDVYRTTGNTLSMVMGLRGMQGDVLVMDGDLLYPREVLGGFLDKATGSCFAVVPVDINDVECAKVLLNNDESIAAIITKRALTDQEKSGYKFSGEAIGFFTLTPHAVDTIIKAYDEQEAHYEPTLWEILFSEIADKTPLCVYPLDENGCFEIDTQEDYEEALACYNANPDRY